MDDAHTAGEQADEQAGEPSWRRRAVAKSLHAARSRAEERAQRFLDSAMALTAERQGTDFTVQDVVEHSQQSLRSFYQYFEGKHGLLLAVFEEAMRASTAELRAEVDGLDDPLERLHRFVVTLYSWCERQPLDRAPAASATVRAMSDFAFQLVTGEPEQAATATADLVDLCIELLAAAQAAGEVQSTRTGRRAAVLLQTVMFNAFGTVRGSGSIEDRAEEMWQFCRAGIAGPPLS